MAFIDDSSSSITSGKIYSVKPVYKTWRTSGSNISANVLVLGDWDESSS